MRQCMKSKFAPALVHDRLPRRPMPHFKSIYVSNVPHIFLRQPAVSRARY